MATRTGMAALLQRIGAIAAVAVMATAGAASAGGGGVPLDWTMDPTSGPAGTTITVTGTCADDENEWEAVALYLQPVPDESEEPTMEEEVELLDERLEPVTPGVEWSFTLVVPEDVEPGTLEVGKQCARLDDTGGFDGGEATTRRSFEVVVAETTTSTPTTTTTSTPEAPSAVAAVETPTFTG